MGITRHPVRAFLVLGLLIICTGCQPGERTPAASEGAPAALLATSTPENTPTETLLSTPSAAPSLATSTPASARATSTLAPYQPGPAIAPLAAGQSIQLVDLFMADATTGWAVEFTGHIVRTTDGGSTWKDVTPPDGAFTPDGFFMQDGQTAWAARDVPPECWEVEDLGNCPVDYYPLAESAVVWKTTDGGAAWVPSAPIRLDDGNAPYSHDGKMAFSPVVLQFVNTNTGWLLAALGMGKAGEYSRLYRSEDAGATWQPAAEFGTRPDKFACQKTGGAFTGEAIGWILVQCEWDQSEEEFSGPVPGILQTTDGGRIWTRMEIPQPAPWKNPEPEVIGGKEIEYQQDQDHDWQIRFQRFPDGSAGVHLLSDRQLFVHLSGEPVAPSAWISGEKGEYGWIGSPCGECGSGFITLGVYGFTTGESEYFLNTLTGWRIYWHYADKKGLVEKTTDGGASWVRQKSVSWRWASFRFIDSAHGWGLVLSEYHDITFVRTSDGGQTWTMLRPVAAY